MLAALLHSVASASLLLPKLPALADEAALSRSHFFSDHAVWLVPGAVLCGRYPGSCPSRPVDADVQRSRLENILEQGITTFVCLQAEIPPQGALTAWPDEGISGQSGNAKEPQLDKFLPYYFDAGAERTSFVHVAIEDRSIASSLELLDATVFDLHNRVRRGERLYVHCFGGRGRTGLVAACLLGALYDGLIDPEEALARVDAYYRLRRRPDEVGSSPETDEQRDQVRDWYRWVKRGEIRVATTRRGSGVE